MDLFERATKQKIRYRTFAGIFTTEDLWDVPLESLDEIAVAMNRDIKKSSSESFINKENKVPAHKKLAFDVVKRVIEVKLLDKERAAKAAETRAKKEKIMELIAKKQEEAFSEQSLEDLQEKLNDLGKFEEDLTD